MAVYETFIVNDISELKDGEEQVLEIRDTATYESRKVRAIISSRPEKLPDGEVLRVLWQRGQAEKKPWAIKITKELGSVFDGLGIVY